MKTFKKAYMPDEIKYNGKTYTYNATITGAMNASGTNADTVINTMNSGNLKKGVLVEVMNPKLKGVTDLRGNYYKPSKFIYTTKN